MNLFEANECLCEEIDATKAWTYKECDIIQFDNVYEVYIDDEYECKTTSFERAIRLALQYQ